MGELEPEIRQQALNGQVTDLPGKESRWLPPSPLDSGGSHLVAAGNVAWRAERFLSYSALMLSSVMGHIAYPH